MNDNKLINTVTTTTVTKLRKYNDNNNKYMKKQTAN